MIQEMAIELFGAKCYAGRYVRSDARFFVRGLILLYWQGMRKQWRKATRKIARLESDIAALRECTSLSRFPSAYASLT